MRIVLLTNLVTIILLPARKQLFVLLATFFLFHFHTVAQPPSNLKVVPPAPEAAALFKFTEVPVSYYSGLANTTIPLYQITAGDVTIPINLSYHGRGVRVEEIAPRVGIGWALNAGGAVGRQVRGIPDDGTPATWNFYPSLFTDSMVALQVYNDLLNVPVDLEPDMYFFDIGGMSGKFMFDPRDKGILLQSYSDIKIVPVLKNDRMEGLIITDDKGNKYYFGLSKDQSRSAFDFDQVHNFSYVRAMKDLGWSTNSDINAWQLMEIETNTNERIEFFYEVENPIYYKRQYDISGFHSRPDQYIPGELTSYFGQVLGTQNQIKEIRFSNGKVLFTPSTAEREDLGNAYALDKLEVFDNTGALIKRFAFQYQYPTTVNDNNQLPYLKGVEPRAAKRLVLRSIQEQGRNGQTVPPYTFTYSDVAMPNRLSNSQDNWGFYNGKPNGPFLTFANSTWGPVVREVDTVKCEAGILKKVTYPTGDTVSFEYEQNRGVPPYFMNALVFPRNNPTQKISILEPFLKHPSYYSNGIYSREVTIGPLDPFHPFQGVKFSFDLPHCTGTSNDDPAVCGYQVWLEGNGNDIFIYPGTVPRVLSIEPGTYKIKVIPPEGHNVNDPNNTFFAKLEWDEYRNIITGGDTSILLLAGKRIKNIEYRSHNGVVKKKHFTYINPATGETSGKMFGLPNFHFRFIEGNGIALVDRYGSLPGSPLTNLQGNGVGYSHVQEYFGDAAANTGKIEYQFTTTEDGGKYWMFPFHLPIDNEWLRGKVLTSSVFEKTASGYLLKKKTVNKYLYADTSVSEGPFFIPFTPAETNNVYSKNRRRFYLPLIVFTSPTALFRVYYQTGGVMHLYNTVETDYEGTDSLKKETNYFFNYDKHYQQTATTSFTSKGDSIRTVTTYVPDIIARSSAEQLLLDLNRIAKPVKVESVVIQKPANTELSRTTSKTQFREWSTNIVEPELTQSSHNGLPLETDLHVFSYDKSGHPTEVAERDGIPVAYVWGYSRQYPVAKVVGANYSTVTALVDTFMLTNAHQYTDAQIRTELNKIRTGLPTAHVTTYTYRPLIGVTSETDPRGRTVFYEYDGLNRLTLIRDHETNIIKKINYAYAAAGIPPLSYQNVAKGGSFTRTDCGTGTPGPAVTYNVPAGTFTSTISQADADQQAINAVTINGPDYANTHGMCTWLNVAKSGTFNKACSVGIGSAVTYTVNAGIYSSTINQEDADQKAQNDVNTNGQNYANTHGFCNITVYASIAESGTQNIFENNCLTKVSNIIVRFYSNAARTIPYSVTNLPIQIVNTATIYTNGQPGQTSSETTGYTCSGTSFTLSGQTIYWGCASNCPGGSNCIPSPNDPYVRNVFTLTNSTFTVQ